MSFLAESQMSFNFISFFLESMLLERAYFSRLHINDMIKTGCWYDLLWVKICAYLGPFGSFSLLTKKVFLLVLMPRTFL